MFRSHIKIMGSALLLASTISGCGIGGSPTSSAPTPTLGAAPLATVTPMPNNGSVATVQPAPSTATPQASAPTAKPNPTVASTQPTVAPQINPIIAFEPQSGGPGTVVNAYGTGYLPNAPIKVRLGLPNPLGEVLASGTTTAEGRWNVQFVMPDRLPSGDIITGENMRLVLMNDKDEALASAPFAFAVQNTTTYPASSREQAQVAVLDMLNGFIRGDDIRPWLSAGAADDWNAGRQTLGLKPGLQRFFIGDLEDDANWGFSAPVEVFYVGGSEQRRCLITAENGQWRIRSFVEQTALPGGNDWPDPRWKHITAGDFNNDGIKENVFVQPSNIVAQAQFSDEITRANATLVSSVMIAQGFGTEARMLVEVDASGVKADGALLVPFQNASPAAFWLAVLPGTPGTRVCLLPLLADGTPAGDEITVATFGDGGSYAVVEQEFTK